MLRRITAGAAAAAAVAAVGLLGAATAAQAETATPTPHVTVVNLHQAYLRALHHVQRRKISGVIYARGHQPKAAQKATAGCTEPNCPLAYNGGPVQHNPHVYLLLWGPNWTTDASQQAAATYLANFYAGLGVAPPDSWSTITTQYSDSTGSPSFTGPAFVGEFNDASTPPTGVTQPQLAAEADAFASARGITDLTDAQIVVATQSGTCPQGFYSPKCGTTSGYCAWHSSSNEPYTNLPYLLDAGTGCGEDFVNPNGTNDGLSIVGGHEYAESITDPIPPTGWIDQNDSVSCGEIGDKCAWGGQLWGSNDPSGNVTLSTGTFPMQSLWSNGANGCVMSGQGGDTVTVTNPGHQTGTVGTSTSLQLQGASTLHNPLTWSDSVLPIGMTLNAATGQISGTPTLADTYDVTVTAKDSTGASGSASFTWTIGLPSGHPITGDHRKCLDDSGGVTNNGNKIDIWTCNGTSAQKWTYNSNGTLSVLGSCLSDRYYTGAGTKLVLWSCIGHRNEQWRHRSNGEYVLASNGLCLTDPSGSTVNGTQVQIRGCRDYADQRWSGP
jgi:serine protease